MLVRSEDVLAKPEPADLDAPRGVVTVVACLLGEGDERPGGSETGGFLTLVVDMIFSWSKRTEEVVSYLLTIAIQEALRSMGISVEPVVLCWEGADQ